MNDRTPMDGFAGALLAVESFSDGHAVLHGPGGCRNYHTFLSSQCVPRSEPGDQERFAGKYFMGMPRLPCTFVDEDDYINGTEEKLVDCIPYVCGSDPDGFFVFVQSPGASLIGDRIGDLISEAGLSDRALAIEESLISQPFAPSYDHTLRSILSWKKPEKRRVRKGTVNIIGIPVTSNDWKDALKDLSDDLGSMGLEVVCALGAGCSLDDMNRSVEAEFNVVVQMEYCRRTAELYLESYGIPWICYEGGAPVGFDAYESWIHLIAETAKADPEPVLKRIKAAKRRAYDVISSSALAKRTEFHRFSCIADSSIALPLTMWLRSYLRMIPSAIVLEDGAFDPYAERLEEFLKEIGCAEALGKDIGPGTGYLFADGNYAALAEKTGRCVKGIDINRPSMHRVGFIPRPVFGVTGAMHILDEIFRRNGPRWRPRPPGKGS